METFCRRTQDLIEEYHLKKYKYQNHRTGKNPQMKTAGEPYPTLTQVPPSLLLSTAIVFAPCLPLALLAQASPPLPPPMTRKSHSLVTRAMLDVERVKCLEKIESRRDGAAPKLPLTIREAKGKGTLALLRYRSTMNGWKEASVYLEKKTWRRNGVMKSRITR